jgi:signal transduction histidine kinase
VLLNLGENAVQFTPPGGHISIEANAERADTVRLSVQDTGAGIAPDLLPHVFSRHFHVRRPDSSTGAGLGLAIVKRIVEAHSGQVTIASTVGNGTTVQVTLPSARALTSDHRAASAASARSFVAQLAQRRG